MFRSDRFPTLLPAVAVALVLATPGCGKEKKTPPESSGMSGNATDPSSYEKARQRLGLAVGDTAKLVLEPSVKTNLGYREFHAFKKDGILLYVFAYPDAAAAGAAKDKVLAWVKAAKRLHWARPALSGGLLLVVGSESAARPEPKTSMQIAGYLKRF